MMISSFSAGSRNSELRKRVLVDEVPGLSITELARTGLQGPIEVTWVWSGGPQTTEIDGDAVGGGWLKPYGADRLLIHWWREDDADLEPAHPCEGIVDLIATANGSVGSRARRRFSCPACNRATSHLYVPEVRWACRICHGLLYRSQYTLPPERDREEWLRLRAEIACGRRRYQRHSEFDAKLCRLTELAAKFGGSAASVSISAERRIETQYAQAIE